MAASSSGSETEDAKNTWTSSPQQLSTAPDLTTLSFSKGELLLAGACAGIINKTATAPMDRIRILFQVNQNRQFSVQGFAETGMKILRKEGPAGLWRGNLAQVVRVAPYAGIQFASFEYYRSALESQNFDHGKPLPVRFCAGSLAGVTATAMTYPLDLLRAQIAVSFSSIHEGPRHPSFIAAADYILRTEGWRGLYKGMQPTLLGIVPHAGVSFMVFETLKPAFQAKLHLDSERELPLVYRLIAGGVAGLVAQGFSYPLHVIRRRMQVQDILVASGKQAPYSSVTNALWSILSTEGILGLYKGASLTLVKGPVSAAIGFASNDFLKGLMRGQGRREEQCPPPGWPVRPEVEREPPRVPDAISRPIEHLISGGAAGAVAKTVIAPADRVKILYQTNAQRQFSWKRMRGTFLTIYRNTGIFGLYRGHSATLLRVIPYSATSFLTFDTYRQWLSREGYLDKVTVRFIAGALAGATATTLTYPLDMMRARMAAHWDQKPRYPNFYTGFKIIITEEGASALFKGLRPTLLGIMPYAGLSFMAYETLKAKLLHVMDLDSSPSSLSTACRLGCGAMAGAFAQTATYPLDIIRRNMQVHPEKYRNEWHALKSIYTTEGLKGGLFKGVSMNWVKGPIAVGVSFTVNDTLKSYFGSH